MNTTTYTFTLEDAARPEYCSIMYEDNITSATITLNMAKVNEILEALKETSEKVGAVIQAKITNSDVIHFAFDGEPRFHRPNSNYISEITILLDSKGFISVRSVSKFDCEDWLETDIHINEITVR